MKPTYDIVVVGGGHAGVEAAWAAANMLGERSSVALVTLREDTIGVMSCNPAIGGLAKGQLVREIDALGGMMGLAADASGIMFKVLNSSRGPAVRGPRCQSDKHLYAETVQALVRSREEIDIIAGAVESFITDESEDGPVIRGLTVRGAAGCEQGGTPNADEVFSLHAGAVVLTTGTFMRGLMHTGELKRQGGREGEAPASAISAALSGLGFELGRLRTGTPPRLRRSSIAWDDLEPQYGDADPTPFSDLSVQGWSQGGIELDRFPHVEQVPCRQTRTVESAHAHIRENIHRAPMYTGELASGPRYCPSIEDKAVRFADRESHGVFLEPESLRTDWIYCNGIATSLPKDVQDVIVHTMPGCENAEILQYGYAVEYDMVRPHQIEATGMTKRVRGLFLAGQINGTSGYEEAAAQGLVAGVNAVRYVAASGNPKPWVLGRDEAYIGVLMDDLVTKTPVEPYRMFTSRAEHRLLLRSDNAADRLTPRANDLGLLRHTEIGAERLRIFDQRQRELAEINAGIDRVSIDGTRLALLIRRPEFDADALRAALPGVRASDASWFTAWAERKYEPYIERQRNEIERAAKLERKRFPRHVQYRMMAGLRTEAAEALERFSPATFGQASRLEGVTPADLTLIAVHLRKGRLQAEEAM